MGDVWGDGTLTLACVGGGGEWEKSTLRAFGWSEEQASCRRGNPRVFNALLIEDYWDPRVENEAPRRFSVVPEDIPF